MSCEILPSLSITSPKRSSRRVSEAMTMRPPATWICAVAASDLIVMTPLFSPLAMMASSSGRVRSRRLPTRAMGARSRRRDLVLAGLLRGVEGDVRRFEELARGGSALGKGRHADAYRDRARVHERERAPLDGHLHALGGHARAVAGGLRQDDHE